MEALKFVLILEAKFEEADKQKQTGSFIYFTYYELLALAGNCWNELQTKGNLKYCITWRGHLLGSFFISNTNQGKSEVLHNLKGSFARLVFYFKHRVNNLES